MPGYRLIFNTMDVRADTLADTLIGADDTMGAVCGPLANFGSLLSNDYMASAHGVTQFVLRFEAPGDVEAYAAAKVGLDSVHLPIDGIKLERRTRRYVDVEVPAGA